MIEIPAYLMCGAVGALVMLLVVYGYMVKPERSRHRRELAEEHAARLAERQEHARRLAAVAVEQMRLHGYGPVSSGAPTVRP
jgi:hypothetical protein